MATHQAADAFDRLRDTMEKWLARSPDRGAAPGMSPAGAAIDRLVVGQMFGDNPEMIERVMKRFAESAGGW